MCRKEIGYYERLNRSSVPSPRIGFVNLDTVHAGIVGCASGSSGSVTMATATATAVHLLEAYNIDIPQAFRRMHVLTEAGAVVKNAEAFVEIWARLPYWKALVPPIKYIPGVIPVANLLYDRFAEKRLMWRKNLPEVQTCSLKGARGERIN